MAPKDTGFSEEIDDKLEYDEGSIEPIGFVPPTASTLSINDIPSLEKISWFNRFSGIIYTLISSLFFTCAAFSIKHIGIDILDALLLRFAIQALFTLLFILYKRYPLLPGTKIQIFLQIVCCATGAGGLFIYFFAMRYIELSDVTTLCYTRVVWTVLLSIFIDRQRPSMGTLLALPLTFIGVIFVTQPTFLFSSTVSSLSTVDQKYRVLGLSLAILTSFTSAANVLSFKRLVSTSKDIKPSVINFQYSLTVLILLIINQFYRKFFLQQGLMLNVILSWKYLLSSFVCLALIFSNILTQKAMKREHPAIFTLLTSADIIFSLILQNIFTTKRSNLYALLGSTLVILSVVIIGITKILHEKRLEKKMKLIENSEEKNGDQC